MCEEILLLPKETWFWACHDYCYINKLPFYRTLFHFWPDVIIIEHFILDILCHNGTDKLRFIIMIIFLIASNLGNCSWKRETSAVYIWTWKSALGRKSHKRNSKDAYIFLLLHSHWQHTNIDTRLWRGIKKLLSNNYLTHREILN